MLKKDRLESLDILRGFDMWLLLMFGPIVGAVLSVVPGLDFVRTQVSHVSWEGFVLWDIIMPLFMFMSGVTIPFSMSRYKEGEKPGKKFWLKLLKRFVLLFVLGWIVQGNLLDLDPKVFHPFANTLQAIAVGYVFSALIFVFCTFRWQVVFTALPFVLYIAAFALTGMNLDHQGNIAMLVDKAVLGSHRDGVSWSGGAWSYSQWYEYTWILSSLNFTVTVMLGCFTGQILKGGKSQWRKAGSVALMGAILLAASLLLSLYFPIIKKIWSSSMTLYAGGISCLLIALSYIIVDILKWRKGLGWLNYYGKNAIAAYFIGEVVNFSSASKSLIHGFEHILGGWYPVLIATANAFILLGILKIMYKRNIFLKV